MPIQTYFCPDHEEMFEISVPFSVKHPPHHATCPLNEILGDMGPHSGDWRPSAAYFIVKEGTGAAKRSPINHA